jgi:hypothetical protein
VRFSRGFEWSGRQGALRRPSVGFLDGGEREIMFWYGSELGLGESGSHIDYMSSMLTGSGDS